MADQKTLSEAENECLSLKKSINENHRLAQKAAADAVDRAVLTGELLGKWKELLPHGKFEKFLEDHFDGSPGTARAYMRAAKGLSELSNRQRTAVLEKESSISGLLKSLKPVSEKGKSGGAPRASSSSAPPSPGPTTGDGAGFSGEDDRTDSPGTTPQEQPPEPSRSDTDKPGDFGICPKCGGKKWTEDEFGASCAKCNHPHGEPVGDQDEKRIGVERSRAIKTVEALMRSVCDLNRLLPKPKEQANLIAQCKLILTELRSWK